MFAFPLGAMDKCFKRTANDQAFPTLVDGMSRGYSPFAPTALPAPVGRPSWRQRVSEQSLQLAGLLPPNPHDSRVCWIKNRPVGLLKQTETITQAGRTTPHLAMSPYGIKRRRADRPQSRECMDRLRNAIEPHQTRIVALSRG